MYICFYRVLVKFGDLRQEKAYNYSNTLNFDLQGWLKFLSQFMLASLLI